MVASVSLRTASWWAYVVTFGALFGYGGLGYTTQTPTGPDTGELWLYAGMALVGSMLLGWKNHRIRNRALRRRTSLGDAVFIVAALALVFILPSYIGLLRGLAVVALVTPYVLWSFRALDAAGEW